MKKFVLTAVLCGALSTAPVPSMATPSSSSSNNNDVVIGLVLLGIIGMILGSQGIGSGTFSTMNGDSDDGREKGPVLQEF